jgi:hypothetical protein
MCRRYIERMNNQRTLFLEINKFAKTTVAYNMALNPCSRNSTFREVSIVGKEGLSAYTQRGYSDQPWVEQTTSYHARLRGENRRKPESRQ